MWISRTEYDHLIRENSRLKKRYESGPVALRGFRLTMKSGRMHIVKGQDGISEHGWFNIYHKSEIIASFDAREVESIIILERESEIKKVPNGQESKSTAGY